MCGFEWMPPKIGKSQRLMEMRSLFPRLPQTMQDNSSNFPQCDHTNDTIASAQNKQEAKTVICFSSSVLDPGDVGRGGEGLFAKRTGWFYGKFRMGFRLGG